MKYEARDPFDPYPGLGSIQSDLTEYEHGTTEVETRDVLASSEEPRGLRGFTILAILLGLGLGLRLVDLQVIEGTRSRVLAEGNRIRSREIAAPRGEIQDRNGVVLADNIASYSLEIYPAELPRRRDEWEEIIRKVGTATGIDINPTINQLEEIGLLALEPIRLAEQLDREQALVWQAKLVDLPGVSVSKTPRREYAAIPGLGHILGYVGRLSEQDAEEWPELSLSADVGKSGLEVMYEEQLQGEPGEKRIEVDARGRVERVLAEIPPTQGNTLKLTLDARLQASLTTRLEEARARREAPAAAAVVINVSDGGILALSSLPGFDPNAFVTDSRAEERQQILTDDRRPLLNRVINGSYPSGSTLKPVIAAAALSEGTITPKTTLDTSSGVIEIGQWRFPDWKVHGIADVRRALAESNDIFFYALGGGYREIPGLGIDRMESWLTKFGFGAKTGIDLPGETTGLVPNDAWKRERINEPWYIGDSYHLAIGQGYFLSTPLQLAQAIATIANGGQIITPHLFASEQDAAGNTATTHQPNVTREGFVEPTTLAIIREGMRLTITDGTARSLGELPIQVAGKTGTAQYGPVVDGKQKTHSWFVGYAPAENPEIAFAFLVEGGGESSDSAVPAAKEFLREWAAIRNP